MLKNNNKYAKLGLKALKRASKKVYENAKRNKSKIPIWKNNQIEFETPPAETEQKNTPDAYPRK